VEQGIKCEKLGQALSWKEPTSYSLVLAARRGDRAAFLELVQGFEAIILRIALNITRDEDAAQDIYCAVFTDAFASLKTLDSSSSIFLWLFRILVRRCLEYCRRHPQRVESNCSEGDSWLWLRGGLRSLTPIEQVIFQLRQYKGLKIRTLAEICDVTPEFVVKALQNVNRNLAQTLSRQEEVGHKRHSRRLLP
jgi:RNA polymerase sigma-70 factor (ECF subfamily)